MTPRIVTFVNAKGGSGATTLATAVARSIRRREPVSLVDGDLSGRRALAIMMDSVRKIDERRIPGKPTVAEIEGFTAVELVDSLDASYTLRADDVEETLLALGSGLTLVDAAQPFAAAVRPAIVRTAMFYIVLEPNLLGTAAARTMLGNLTRFGVPVERITLVTNLRGGKSEISGRELERLLGVSVAAEIPLRTDRQYDRSIDSLVKKVAAVSNEESFELRRASAATPLGDRRSRERRPTGDSGAQSPAAQRDGAAAPLEEQQLAEAAVAALKSSDMRRDALKGDIHEALSKRIDLVATSRAHSDGEKLAELRVQVSAIADQLLSERSDVASAEEVAHLRQEIIDEALGFGPLEDLMRDERVTEIMVNGAHRIYVERKGKLELSNKRFVDERQLRSIIERIIAPLGRRIDESQPMVDARLPDGSRVNAIIEPLALNGSTLTIRRFGTKRLEIEDLIKIGALAEPCADLLRAMVEGRLNIIVSGGTGSGKTTLLNVLSGFLPNTERIVTIEDAAELLLKQDHVVRLESRPPNLEGRGAIGIRELVKNSLRMRPDRIIVGECRSGEALDMLQAMNTGHDGSLTTVHANTPRDAVARLETLVMMAGFDLPVRAIREQIASAVNIIVQTSRLRDGSRKVMSISEIVGMECDIVTMQEIVRYNQRGLDKESKVIGEFQYTGVQPECLAKFEEVGVTYDLRGLSALRPATAAW